MNSEPTRVDIPGAAERQYCSTKTIRRRIGNGTLPAVTERVLGQAGRVVHRLMIEVADLDAAFPPLPVEAEPMWLDMADAAARQGCSTTTIRRYIQDGRLPTVSELVLGRHGRVVRKILIEASDLDAVFPPPPDPAEEARLLAEFVASAPRITDSQRIRIMAIFNGYGY